jgi:hypothetical protein
VIIGGRLYFLATSWDQAPHEWWGPVEGVEGRPRDLGGETYARETVHPL